MKRCLLHSRLALTLCIAVIAGACAGNESDASDSAPVAPATTPTSVVTETADTEASQGDYSLDGLADGTHLGISAFSPPAPEFADEWSRRWDEANDAATIGRVLIDWIDVEPARGEYRTAELEERLRDVVERGQQPMLTIAAVDVSGTPFPEWLGGFEPESAAIAFNDMIDAIEPTLVRHGVWLLAVANEPPFDEGLDRTEFADFVSRVNVHVDDTIPGLATTFVFAGDDALGPDPATEALRRAVDVLALNHYCIEPSLFVTPIDDTEHRLDEIVAHGNGKPIVFQEFGCPAAESIGSSDEMQAEWFERAFAFIDDEPSVRAAFVFEFQDWSAETVEGSYGGAFDDEPELAEFAARFEDWLRTTGLFRDDMSPRPAYAAFLDAAGR